MIWIMIVGAIIALTNVVLTFIELQDFLKALRQLNHYTDTHKSIGNRLMWPFRFITLLPKAWPLVVDGTIAVVCGGIGLGGGVFGALIGLSIGFTASLLIKLWRLTKPKDMDAIDWRVKESTAEYCRKRRAEALAETYARP